MILPIIEKKKNGLKLTKAEIFEFVHDTVDGSAADYQISALLMAMFIRGLDGDETAWLTEAMTESGKRVERGGIRGIVVDKHSTGGVSDTTSLIVVPVCVCLGFKVAKLSGRGLGFTGGTLDKLESFEGFNVNLTAEQFTEQVNEVGGAISGQTDDVDPADKKLYALRDVTGTVDSIPLIAASIMSKKLAAFADCIVLDVKYGSGAFMKTAERAQELARVMVEIGKRAGRKTTAVVSSMRQPLGNGIGCNLEVRGAIDVLRGEKGDLYRLSKLLCAQFLVQNGCDERSALARVDEAIDSGAALAKLREIVAAQGGSTMYIDSPQSIPLGAHRFDFSAQSGGYVTAFETEKLGELNVLLGGGRLKKGDVIDHTSGILLRKRIDDFVERGETLFTLYCSDTAKLDVARSACNGIVTISPSKTPLQPLVLTVIG